MGREKLSAAQETVLKYQDFIKKIALRQANGNTNIAEEAAGKVTIKLLELEKEGFPHGIKNIKGYIGVAVRNTVISEFRALKRRRAFASHEQDRHARHQVNIKFEEEKAHTRIALRTVLDTLEEKPDTFTEALVEFAVAGNSGTLAAKNLSINGPVLRKRVQKARRRLEEQGLHPFKD